MRTVQEMLTTLKTKGWSDARIGEELATPAPTIFRLRKGDHQRTNYERYAAIQKLVDRVERRKAA